MADAGTVVAAYQGRPPYLTLWDLISLGWLYYPIISLLFVAFSLWLASQSATAGVADAKKALIAACGTAEKSATVAASLPRFIAQSTNDELNNAIRDSLNASHEALNVVLTVVESIIDFVIDSFKSLQLCLFQFVIRGTLAVLIQITLSAQQFISGAVGGIANGIQASITATTSGVNDAIDTINNVINKFNGAIPSILPIPHISTISHVTLNVDLTPIRNFTVPNTFSNDLIALNNSIPTLDQLRADLQNIVDIPFNALKAEMNTTFASISTPNVTVPLPAMQEVQFCGDLDTGFIDDLGRDLVRIAHIGIGILVAIAVLIFIFNGFLTWIRWQFLNRHVAEVRERWAAGYINADRSSRKHFRGSSDEKGPVKSHATLELNPEALLTLDNELSHSFAYKVLDMIDSIPFLHLSQVSHDRLAWYLSYIFSPSALVCFLVGSFGLIAIGIQLIAIKPIQLKVTAEVEDAVQTVANSLGLKINSAMLNNSAAYAADVNTQLQAIDTAINGEFFGWITNATSVLNNTIVAFYDDLENGIQTAFNGTLFASPMLEFLRCVVGGKIQALEDAVGFLQANLHIPIPRVNTTILMLSNQTLLQVSAPVADAAVGGNDGSEGVFGKLVDRYLQALRSELITFGVILGVWGFICVMGLAILLWDIISHWQKTPKKPKTPKLPKGSKSSEDGSVEGILASTTPKFNPKMWLQRFKSNWSRSTAHQDQDQDHAFARDEERAKNDGASTIAPSPVTTPVSEEPPRIIRIPSGYSY